jgi:hypothetical protein
LVVEILERIFALGSINGKDFSEDLFQSFHPSLLGSRLGLEESFIRISLYFQEVGQRNEGWYFGKVPSLNTLHSRLSFLAKEGCSALPGSRLKQTNRR